VFAERDRERAVDVDGVVRRVERDRLTDTSPKIFLRD
jgi:hypothetical protein